MAFAGRSGRHALPLGTFLGLAGIAVVFAGEPVLDWYGGAARCLSFRAPPRAWPWGWPWRCSPCWRCSPWSRPCAPRRGFGTGPSSQLNDAMAAARPLVAQALRPGGYRAWFFAANEALRQTRATEAEVFDDRWANGCSPTRATRRSPTGRARPSCDRLRQGEPMTVGPLAGRGTRIVSYVYFDSGGRARAAPCGRRRARPRRRAAGAPSAAARPCRGPGGADPGGRAGAVPRSSAAPGPPPRARSTPTRPPWNACGIRERW